MPLSGIYNPNKHPFKLILQSSLQIYLSLIPTSSAPLSRDDAMSPFSSSSHHHPHLWSCLIHLVISIWWWEYAKPATQYSCIMFDWCGFPLLCPFSATESVCCPYCDLPMFCGLDLLPCWPSQNFDPAYWRKRLATQKSPSSISYKFPESPKTDGFIMVSHVLSWKKHDDDNNNKTHLHESRVGVKIG